MMRSMNPDVRAMEAFQRAQQNVPRVIKKYLAVTGISQEQIGAVLGLTQRQMSRRLCVPGALAQEEVAAIAVYFGVPVETLQKPVPEAIGDLMREGRVYFTEDAEGGADNIRYVAGCRETTASVA